MSPADGSTYGTPGGKKRPRAAVKKQDLPAELARLQTLTLPELKAKWAELYGKPLKGGRRDFLTRGIAYRLQELVYGGLSAKTRGRLKQLAKQFARNPDHRPAVAPDLKPGCRLLREWRGVMHEVVVLEKGFRYRDQSHRTLSEIARLITGTRWSGPVFFGVKKVGGREGARQSKGRRDVLRRGRQTSEVTKSEHRRQLRYGADSTTPEFSEPLGDVS
jgi:hypothetical protein